MILVLCLSPVALLAQEPARRELERHQGTWVAVLSRRDGQDAPRAVVKTITRTVEGDRVVWKRDGKSFAGARIVLDPSRTPPAIDVIPDGGPSRGKRVLGVYRLEGDRLTLCMADADQPRPREFRAEKGSKTTLMVFERKGVPRQETGDGAGESPR